MLFSVADLEKDFENFEFSVLEEVEIELSEGAFHIGKGSVVRLVGKKIK